VSSTVALVSCAEARDFDTDLPLLVRAFGDRGILADIVNWDDDSIVWDSYRAAIVRSPWDYHRRYAAFLAWIETSLDGTPTRCICKNSLMQTSQ
jgi:hypothetical protein